MKRLAQLKKDSKWILTTLSIRYFRQDFLLRYYYFKKKWLWLVVQKVCTFKFSQELSSSYFLVSKNIFFKWHKLLFFSLCKIIELYTFLLMSLVIHLYICIYIFFFYLLWRLVNVFTKKKKLPSQFAFINVCDMFINFGFSL